MAYDFKPTIRGYDYFESLSALQKFCRRGMKDEAFWMFLELEASGYFSHAINRLEVIIYEDVGIANKELFYGGTTLIARAKEAYKTKKEMWVLIVSPLIFEICESEKTRLAGEFLSSTCKMRFDQKKIDIPDYAFDKHTMKGKKMGRGLKHFFDESSKLIPQSEQYAVYKQRGEESWLFFEENKLSGLKESRREPNLFS